MQVRFNNEGCFIEKDSRLIAKERIEGCMFILDSNEGKSAMYVKDLKAETKIELWHKRISHINLQPPTVSCRHTTQQNGVAERKNRHILEVACAMMHEKHMLNFYWAEATSMTVYLMNQCTTNGMHELNPYEILVGRKPIHSHLKVFGSIANVRIPKKPERSPT